MGASSLSCAKATVTMLVGKYKVAGIATICSSIRFWPTRESDCSGSDCISQSDALRLLYGSGEQSQTLKVWTQSSSLIDQADIKAPVLITGRGPRVRGKLRDTCLSGRS